MTQKNKLPSSLTEASSPDAASEDKGNIEESAEAHAIDNSRNIILEIMVRR